jgi:hypothetical protein
MGVDAQCNSKRYHASIGKSVDGGPMRKGSLSFSTALAGMTAPRRDIGWTTVPLFTGGRSDRGKSLLPLKGESFRESFLQCTSLQAAHTRHRTPILL